MGYGLLWLECLAFAVLYVAGTAAATARFKKWKTLWPILAAAFFLVLGTAASVFSGFLFFKNIHPQWVFPYALSWTVVLIAALGRMNHCDKDEKGEYAPLQWSANKLAFANFFALGLLWVTFDSLDNARKLEAITFQTTALTKTQTIFKSPPPAGRDAAPYYEQAIKELGVMPKGIWENGTNPALDVESVKPQDLLADKAHVLRLVKKGSRKPFYYFPLELNFDHLPQFSHFRDANALLAIQARLRAKRGDIKGALKNISVMHKIGDQVLQTPTLLNAIMASALYGEAVRALEVVLAEWNGQGQIPVSLKTRDYEALPRAFRDGLMFEDAVQIFMLVEILIKHPSMSMTSLRQGNDWVEQFGNKLYRVFLLEGDLNYHEKYWSQMHELTNQPYLEIKHNLQDWEKGLEENPDHGLLTSIASITSFSRYFDKIYRAKTHLHLKDLGRAVAAYQARFNKYPLTLDVLVPKFIAEIPKDPFDGKPVRMKWVEDGAILYGVGEDQKDDGGAEWNEDTKTGDITFVLGSAFKERRLQPALEAMTKEK